MLNSSRLAIATLLMLLCVVPAGATEQLVFGSGADEISHANFIVLQEAYSRIGITIKSRLVTYDRALLEARTGNTDGLINRFRIIEERCPNLVRVNYPVNKIEGVALAVHDLPYNTPEDLNTYRVGIRSGIVKLEKLTKDMPSVTRLSERNMLVKMLLSDRLDVILVNRHWAEKQIANYPDSGLHILEPPLFSIPTYHYVNRLHADLVPKLIPVLREMDQSGLSDRLRREALNNYE